MMLPIWQGEDVDWRRHSSAGGYMWTYPIWNISFVGKEWEST